MKKVVVLILVLSIVLAPVFLSACSNEGNAPTGKTLITKISENPRQWEGKKVNVTGTVMTSTRNEISLTANDGSFIKVRYNGQLLKIDVLRDVEVTGIVRVQTSGNLVWSYIEALSWKYID